MNELKTWKIKTVFINPDKEKKEVEIERATADIDLELILIKKMLENNNCEFLSFEYQVIDD